MKKQILIGSISAFVAGVIFHVLIPAVLQFAVSVLLSAATILDPLLILAGGSLIFAGREMVISFLVLFLVLVILTAPFIGLICTGFVRKYRVQQE